MQGFLSFSSRKKRENGKFPGCSFRVSDTHKDWQLITCSFSAIYRANGNLFFLVIVFASMIKDSASFRLWFYWSFPSRREENLQSIISKITDDAGSIPDSGLVSDILFYSLRNVFCIFTFIQRSSKHQLVLLLWFDPPIIFWFNVFASFLKARPGCFLWVVQLVTVVVLTKKIGKIRSMLL